MATKEEMLATMEAFGERDEPRKLEMAINCIMVAMTKEGDNRRVYFCDLSGNVFPSIEIAEEAIDKGEFCAYVA